MLNVRDLTLKTPDHRTLFDRFNLSLNRGECLAIMGPNGAGKSALLHALAGLSSLPTEGQISHGKVVWQDGRLFVPAHLRSCTLVMQDPAIWPHLSALQQLRLVPQKSPRPSIGALIELFALTDVQHQSGHTLSGGQKARLALARAVRTGACLLLLDEPFASMDQASEKRMIKALLCLQEEFRFAMIAVTHNQESASTLSSGRILQL